MQLEKGIRLGMLEDAEQVDVMKEPVPPAVVSAVT